MLHDDSRLVEVSGLLSLAFALHVHFELLNAPNTCLILNYHSQLAGNSSYAMLMLAAVPAVCNEVQDELLSCWWFQWTPSQAPTYCYSPDADQERKGM